MARLPHAAHALIRNVLAYDLHLDCTIGRIGDPDGLGVVRSVQFDPDTSTWLYPLLRLIADTRIEALTPTPEGLIVTFVANTKADNRDSFPLVDAAYVLGLDKPSVPETGVVPDLDDPLTPDEPT